jgi:tetratricopeptide (TPR) repeat protein
LPAIRLKPDYAEAHLNLGVALAKQQKYDEAIVHFEAALRIDPNYATAKKYLDAARLRRKQP